MIVCHRYELIFVKSLKTAGTSIEVAIGSQCGPDDIVTPIFPAIPGHHARNWRASFMPFREVRSMADLKKNLRELARRDRFYNHIPARFARARLPNRIWESYLKICVERNPWDKTLSHFHMFRNAEWHQRYNPNLTLDAYLDNGIFCRNLPFYCDVKGEIIVDRIVRYDRLEEDLTKILRDRGMPFDGLPQAKSGLRNDRRSYKEILTSAQAERIKDAFATEIDLHGWEY